MVSAPSTILPTPSRRSCDILFVRPPSIASKCFIVSAMLLLSAVVQLQ